MARRKKAADIAEGEFRLSIEKLELWGHGMNLIAYIDAAIARHLETLRNERDRPANGETVGNGE